MNHTSAVELGSSAEADVGGAQRVLGLSPRPAREAVLTSGRSMLEHGIVTAPGA